MTNQPFVCPVSFSQQRLWFVEQLLPGTSAYHIFKSVRFAFGVDAGVLRRSMNEIVRRHEALRTTFRAEDGVPMQVVAPALDLALPLIDLQHLPREAADLEATRLAELEARQPFDLARGPLLRTTLLRLGPRDHVFLLALHHIVADGWSMQVLFRELFSIYDAFHAGQPSPLPELPIQYADFTMWHREWLSGPRLETQLAYWRRQLADLAGLSLPTDRPRPPRPAFRGGKVAVEIPPATSQALRQLCQDEKATLFMALLATFEVLLHRYTGEEDLAIGSPIANRGQPELEGLIGFFVNTLVFRGDLSGRPSFREVLRRVRETALEAYAHQDLPFERLVDELQPQRDLTRNPLFQVMFQLFQTEDDGNDTSPAGEETAPAPLDVDTGSVQFDLVLNLWGGQRVRGELEYDADLFDRETAARMAARFVRLMESAIAAPDQPIADLPLMSDDERAYVLAASNAMAAPPRCDESLQAMFEQQVDERPDAVALECGERWLTYSGLNDRANALAHALIDLGAGPEVRVGVCAGRSPGLLVALLGVLKSGATYVPLDPAFPHARLDFMRRDSRVALLVTGAGFHDHIAAFDGPVIALDDDDCPAGWPTALSSNPSPAERRHAAYILYTSGSSGEPKGVIVEHESIASHARSMAGVFGLTRQDRVLQFASPAFDVSLEEILPTLISGATVVVPPVPAVEAPRDFLRGLSRAAVTVINIPTGYWHECVADAVHGRAAWPDCLRLVVIGSERADPARVADWQRSAGARIKLLNGYGTTETTITSLIHELQSPEAWTADGSELPIGRPLGHARAYVLDGRGALLPLDLVGSLHIGGRGVAREYVNHPDLTREKFADDPFMPGAGGRMYATGDLVRLRGDGTIEYRGRIDRQLKIRGFRVEPSEVESALHGHPDVIDAAVVRGHGSAGDTLEGYVACPPSAGCSADDIRRFVRGRLPEYMVPSTLTVVPVLPRLPNGKVDVRALGASGRSRMEGRSQKEAPRTELERRIAAIWREVLGAADIGRDEEFFKDLGGHSLLATRVMSRVQDAFAVDLPLRAIFESPTVAGLAQAIDAAAGAPARHPIRALTGMSTRWPLSCAQERLWFLDQLVPGNPFYNIPVALSFLAGLDVEALERAVNEIVRRHAALRTTFAADGGQPAQTVAPAVHVDLPIVDLRHLSPDSADEEAHRLADAEARRPFDLTQAPLLRTTVLRMEEQRHILLLTLHHIVADGWSMGLLYDELAILYGAFVQGRGSPLGELPIQYTDFAVWQRERLRDVTHDEQVEYWKRQLADLPALALPVNRARPARPAFHGARVAVEIPERLTLRVQALCREEGVTLFMALLTAFQVLLSRYSGQEDLAIGSPIANRHRTELEGLIGFFVNTLVLRADLRGTPTARELLRRVRETALGAYAHQDVPFEHLVDILQPQRELTRNPLFQVMFQLYQAPDRAPDEATLRPVPVRRVQAHAERPFEVESGTSKFDLFLNIIEGRDGRLRGTIEYDVDLFDAAMIARIPGHFVQLLEGMADDPELPVGELPMLTETERTDVLERWNATRVAYPRDATIHDLFEAQAAARPGAIAAVCGDREVTYEELNRQANHVSRALIAAGVQPETLVGVCLPRSLEMLVAMLGILKAGGAYVPFDPGYPREHLAFMLRDTRAPVMLVDASAAACLPTDAVDASGPRLLRLDAIVAAADAPADDPKVTVAAGGLAYVMYTSGSTGAAKGVAIVHRGVVRLVINANYARLDEQSVLLHASSISFDASTFEIWGALLNGGKVVVFPDRPLDLDAVGETIERHGVTTVWLTAGLFHQMVDGHVSRLRGVRQLLAGGDVLNAAHVRRAMQLLPDCDVINGYGPTENTTFSCCHRMTPQCDLSRSVPIGRPIANTTVFVLDANRQPAPIGVPGELFVGGDGLARGYLHDPELTAARFVANPFNRDPSERLYRTGDRVRMLEGGTVEFLGRVDCQLKVRGFRVEPAEIEAVLEAHPAVQTAVVIGHRQAEAETRLVAHVVPRAGWQAQTSEEPLAAEHISEWQRIYDDIYAARDGAADPTFNIAGWHSSYTGLPLPADEMREWLECTVARILGAKPRRVLEIGCGSGLLLFRIAPHATRYCGADFSAAAIDYLSEQPALAALRHVELLTRSAHDFSGFEPAAFDAVILNSVAQYFPSRGYLEEVLQGAMRVLAPGGLVFVGDLRSLSLLEAFHASVELDRAADATSAAAVRGRIDTRILQEQELVVSPAFFDALRQREPRVTDVQVLPKRGRCLNELTRFRCDVELRLDGPPPQVVDGWIDWRQHNLSLSDLRARIAHEQPAILGLTSIPNARVSSALRAAELLATVDDRTTVGEVKREAAATRSAAVDPEDLWTLAADMGRVAHVRDRGAVMDVVFTTPDADRPCAFPALDHDGRDGNAGTNTPLQGKRSRGLAQQLRAHVAGRLPEYMMPASFLLRDELPLTANGKVDRSALSGMDGRRPDLVTPFVAPRTRHEQVLATAWSEVLGVERIGIHDNFFELGGDSILCIQVIARARAAGLRLSPKEMFEHQTIAALAAVGVAVAPAAAAEAPSGEVPLTPVQHWFFEQELEDVHHFNHAVWLPVDRDADPAALGDVLRDLQRHHDALRLRFDRGPAGWTQRYASLSTIDEALPLPVVDLSALAGAELTAAMNAHLAALHGSLDIAQGPLVRASIFRLPHGGDRVLLLVHHLAIDGVSWRILLDDWCTALDQRMAGAPAALPPRTTSFQRWARALAEHSGSAALLADAPYWEHVCASADIPPMPQDFSDGENTVASERSVRVAVTADATRSLLEDVPAAYRTQMDEVLLTAFARAYERWTGSTAVFLDVEGHGREALGDDLDVSRTVGWFTSIYPVALRLPPGADIGAALRHVKEHMRGIPGRGLGYGVLRYLSPDADLRDRLRPRHPAQIAFNYLGQFGSRRLAHRAPDQPPETTGPACSPRQRRGQLLQINGSVTDGRLEVTLSFSAAVHRESTIAALGRDMEASLLAIVEHCQSPDAGEYTPSDFPDLASSDADLERILGELRSRAIDHEPTGH